jgi:hypothetical protein
VILSGLWVMFHLQNQTATICIPRHLFNCSHNSKWFIIRLIRLDDRLKNVCVFCLTVSRIHILWEEGVTTSMMSTLYPLDWINICFCKAISLLGLAVNRTVVFCGGGRWSLLSCVIRLVVESNM